MFLLDTNICIPLLTGRDRKLTEHVRTLRPSELALCSIVKAELLYGARKSERVDENLSLLQRFFEQFDCLPFDDRAAEHYGVIRVALARAGTPIGNSDLLIAAIALASDLTVVTRNRAEFARVPGLRLETW